MKNYNIANENVVRKGRGNSKSLSIKNYKIKY